MTASSSYNNLHAPFLGRLHRAKRGRYVGAWCARHNNHNQWLQVDLGRTMKITGIATQGRQDADQWVTAYWVYYSLNGVQFSRIKEWWDTVKVGCYLQAPKSFILPTSQKEHLWVMLRELIVNKTLTVTRVHCQILRTLLLFTADNLQGEVYLWSVFKDYM